MPLQIRRGTDAERQAMTVALAAGELLYVTDDQRLFIGNGTTLGGVQITGYTDGDAKDAAAAMFTTSTHSGITFTYDTVLNKITASVDLSDYTGVLRADLKGSIVADDSTMLVDGVSGRIVGPVYSNVTGNLTGNVTGDVAGNVTGDVAGNVTGNVTGNLTGNSTGYHTGDVKGSVVADDSTILVDGVSGRITGPLYGNAYSSSGTLLLDSSSGYYYGELHPTGRGVIIDGPYRGIRINSEIDSNDPYDLFTINSAHADTQASGIILQRSKGTIASPMPVSPGDELVNFYWFAEGGSGKVLTAALSAQVDPNGTVSSTIIPGKISLVTWNSAGNPVEGLSVDKDGIIGIVDNSLTAGVGSGQVNTGGTVKYIKIDVAGTYYAMPLYPLNP